MSDGRKPAEKEFSRAQLAYEKIVSARDREIAKRCKVIEDELTTQYEGRRLAALKRVNEAQAALNAALVEAAATQKLDGRHPVGTVLYEWDWARWDRVWIKTGRSARVTVASPEVISELAGNRRRPYVGRLILRHLKKDGSPSAKFEEWASKSWLPEGQEPPAKS